MGRKKINAETVVLRLPAGTLGRIDRLCRQETRTDWLRRAVESALAREEETDEEQQLRALEAILEAVAETLQPGAKDLAKAVARRARRGKPTPSDEALKTAFDREG